VRLKYGYVVTCDAVVRDPTTGKAAELRCSYDPASGKGGGEKVKGIIQWVSRAHAVDAEVGVTTAVIVLLMLALFLLQLMRLLMRLLLLCVRSAHAVPRPWIPSLFPQA